MKKLYYTTKVLAVLLVLFTMKGAAQLSGIVTIDNTLPASATNYTSFSSFAAVVNTAGINAPLTVNVVAGSGPYNEQVNFTAIAGTSATNTITVNGNGCTISFSATSSSTLHTFMLSGTDFMKVNNLNIVGTSSTNALPLHLWNGADNNSFNTCTVSVPANVTAAAVNPISVSGSSTSATSTGVNLNDEFVNCLVNGGYYGVVIYGPTTSPYTSGHKVVNCRVLDSYYYSIYLYYNTDALVSANIIERANRTTIYSGTSAGIYLNGTMARVTAEKNYIRNVFSTVTTNSFYGIYLGGSATLGNEVIIKNNIISDIKCNGTVAGIYNGSYNNHIYMHNTISLDDAGATAGTTYGIYAGSGPITVKNNIVTITRGGTGSKYCIYYSGTANTTQFNSSNNVIFMNSPAGTNILEYIGTNMTSLSAMQTLGYELGSSTADPLYAIPGTNYAPTSLAVNNLGTPVGVTDDINAATRSLSSPDPGAIEIFNANCFGSPGTSTISVPTFTFCRNSQVNLVLAAGVYSNSGISYQWVSSTSSAFGPFTAITGGTLATLKTPATTSVTTYYAVEVSCAGGGTTTVPAATVFMQPTVISTIPYYESFENLNSQILLPNCSWAVSNTVTALTQTTSNTNGRIPRTGTNFAMFFNAPTGVNSFYTNGIQLLAGVTYSASLWWLTESVGYTNWTDLSILVGSNQSPVGQVTVASTNGPATSPVHKQLTGTFSVSVSGIYYVAVRATSASGSAQYLSFDDLRVGIPCSLNSPTVMLNTLSSTVCSDKPMTISASGADTYTWNTGDNSSAITVTPGVATTGYTVWATQLLSGCTSSFVQNITVNPSPIVFVASDLDEVCAGSRIYLSAHGTNVDQYFWSNSVNGQDNVVYPTSNTVYTVTGISTNGCSASATKAVTVKPLPVINASANPSQICSGEAVTLTGNVSGGAAATYSWVSNTSVGYIGNPITLNPQVSSVFSVTAMDNNGCSNTTMLTLFVQECTGLAKLANDNSVNVYPNPSAGVFEIEFNTAAEKTIQIVDLTGRVIYSNVTNDTKIDVNIKSAANGVYYLKLQSGKTVEVVKIVKVNN